MPARNLKREFSLAKADPCMRKPPVCDFRTQHCFSKDMESYECEGTTVYFLNIVYREC